MSLHLNPVAAWRRLLAAVWLAVSLAGCVHPIAAPAEAPVAYARGDLETDLGGDYLKVLDACRGALADLGFGPASENQDPAKVTLVSRTPGDKRIEITLGKSDNKLTNIKIRVGVFGDEQVSRSIFEKIKARL